MVLLVIVFFFEFLMGVGQWLIIHSSEYGERKILVGLLFCWVFYWFFSWASICGGTRGELRGIAAGAGGVLEGGCPTSRRSHHITSDRWFLWRDGRGFFHLVEGAPIPCIPFILPCARV